MKTFTKFFFLHSFVCILIKSLVFGFPVPFNQYSYIVARNQLQKIDSLDLKETSEKERIVALYFEKLKSDEFKRTKKHFHGSKPIETEFNQIKGSELFSKLKFLPKGGNFGSYLNLNVFIE